LERFLTLSDHLELTALMFDWGDSYDAKVLQIIELNTIGLSIDIPRIGLVSVASSPQLFSSTTPTLGNLVGQQWPQKTS
jgi:hypothetical protein